MPTDDESNPSGQESGVRIGALLRASRLRMGEDLEHVSQTLRIRLRHLEAIEDGRYEELPGSTYAIGFIRAYASYLGLDGQEVVRRFKGETTTAGRANELRFLSPAPEGGIPRGALLFVGALIAVLAYGAWYVSTTDQRIFAELIPPLPERLAALLRSDEPPARPTEAAESPAEAPRVMAREQRETVPLSFTPSREAAETEGGAPERPAEGAPAVRPATIEPSPARPISMTADPAPVSPGALPATPRAEATPSGRPATPAAPLPTAAIPTPAATTTTPSAAPAPAAPAPGTPTTPAALSAAPSAMPSPSTSPREIAAQTSTPPPTETAPRPEAPRPATETAALPPAPTAAPGTAVAPVTSAATTLTAGAADADRESRIVVRARSASWIQVRDETGNQLLVTRLMRPGDVYRVPDRPGLKLLTGNAGALEILVDGKLVPPVGPSGEVRRDIALDAERLRQGTAGGN